METSSWGDYGGETYFKKEMAPELNLTRQEKAQWGEGKENISKVDYCKAKVCFCYSRKMGCRVMFKLYFTPRLLLFPGTFTATLKVPGNPRFFRQGFEDHHTPQEGCFLALSSARPRQTPCPVSQVLFTTQSLSMLFTYTSSLFLHVLSYSNLLAPE